MTEIQYNGLINFLKSNYNNLKFRIDVNRKFNVRANEFISYKYLTIKALKKVTNKKDRHLYRDLLTDIIVERVVYNDENASLQGNLKYDEYTQELIVNCEDIGHGESTRSYKITKSFKIPKGLYLTEYDNSFVVYCTHHNVKYFIRHLASQLIPFSHKITNPYFNKKTHKALIKTLLKSFPLAKLLDYTQREYINNYFVSIESDLNRVITISFEGYSYNKLSNTSSLVKRIPLHPYFSYDTKYTL